MSLPKLSPVDLDTLVFKRFKGVYGYAGAWAYKDDPQTFSAEWLKMFRHCSKDEVSRGVDVWMTRKVSEWPKPGELLDVIKDTAPKRSGTMVKDSWREEDCPCGRPGCGWHWYDLRPGVYRLVNDCVARRDGLTLHSFGDAA